MASGMVLICSPGLSGSWATVNVWIDVSLWEFCNIPEESDKGIYSNIQSTITLPDCDKPWFTDAACDSVFTFGKVCLQRMKFCQPLFLTLLVLALTGVSSHIIEPVDLESELIPWSVLKVLAGYYDESGVYRGGLYRRASDEEHEMYTCVQNNTDHCLTWMANERSSGEVEQGTCYCREIGRASCRERV